ncbi:sulfotransferase [Sphingomonas sp. AR_OL41]|uniref:tetratricopeptide repeat-containing sulfotransferase family protein n=1 Tax=Sphingomonas sp. AR_OL41 TaxID=3042729 RepID=UPI002481846F|nr:tetratricopeptide repeat-containing sulfotransferase family protein [Sphingomonas sp. AR_OL41]MDH7974313.1 sulfotransferase [Sphingomonas sp. AR_OL41]
MASAPPLDQRTAAALGAAMAAARAGDLPGAGRIAEQALVQGGDVVALNAFLGMLCARSGNLDGAIRHLHAAHRRRPGDTTIACNLITALIDTGDIAGAFEIATRDLALADPTLRVARYRGFLAQSLERFADAAEAYEHVLARAPDEFESLNNLGNARAALGDANGAVAALHRAVALDPNAPPTRLNLATALRAAGRDDEAEAVLNQAASDFPVDARPLHDLYVLLKDAGRDAAALDALERAIGRDPANANLQFKAAVEYGLVMRVALAERAYRAALDVDPRLTDAYLGLAIQYEHTNREEEFAPLIARAESAGVDEGALGFIRAMEHRREKRFEEGLACLTGVPASIEPERTAHLRATLLDRLGRTDEAFAWFAEAGRLHQADPSDPLARAAETRQTVRDEIAQLTPAWAATWQKPVPAADPAYPDPVFLVGFPRSGTTLLDTILMGHPDTIVLEEQPPLNYVDERLGGMMCIPELDAEGIAAARAHYFTEVAKIAELRPGALLIDKSPLFLLKAPLIHRLFPRARFILALRHPCDVVLSCFISNFRLNPAMSNFLRPEDAAEYYDLTFRHWERSRSLFPLEVHTIGYEQLVENVEEQVRPLFDFLGLDWNDAALDHRKTARARGFITTASYAQVTEPIYKRASGRWQRYREHLAPILPVLAPWVEKFGYDL